MLDLVIFIAIFLFLPLIVSNILLLVTKNNSRKKYFAVSLATIVIFALIVLYNLVLRDDINKFSYFFFWIVPLSVASLGLLKKNRKNNIGYIAMLTLLMLGGGFVLGTSKSSLCIEWSTYTGSFGLPDCVSYGPDVINRGFPLEFYSTNSGISFHWLIIDTAILFFVSMAIVLFVQKITSKT